MIPARPSALFRSLFAAHVRGRVRARFSGLWVEGLATARAALAEGPLIVVANHACWWDPLVALLLSEALRADGRAMMDARNLRRLPFFRLLGAFGVDLDAPRDGALALRYAGRHLRGPGRLVWIFPQGRERPEDPRPLGFLGGSLALLRLAPQARVLPVAMRFSFLGQERPEIRVAIGAPSRPTTLRELEEPVEALLDGLDRGRGAPATGEALLLARPARLSSWAERALGLLVRPWLGEGERRPDPPSLVSGPGQRS